MTRRPMQASDWRGTILALVGGGAFGAALAIVGGMFLMNPWLFLGVVVVLVVVQSLLERLVLVLWRAWERRRGRPDPMKDPGPPPELALDDPEAPWLRAKAGLIGFLAGIFLTVIPRGLEMWSV